MTFWMSTSHTLLLLYEMLSSTFLFIAFSNVWLVHRVGWVTALLLFTVTSISLDAVMIGSGTLMVNPVWHRAVEVPTGRVGLHFFHSNFTFDLSLLKVFSSIFKFQPLELFLLIQLKSVSHPFCHPLLFDNYCWFWQFFNMIFL